MNSRPLHKNNFDKKKKRKEMYPQIESNVFKYIQNENQLGQNKTYVL